MTTDRKLLPPADAAKYLGGIVPHTLAKWRIAGTGPEFVRIGRLIMYEPRALDEFIAANRCRSTSEGAA